jgi:F5/8 type C domain/Glycosyl hydrolases family 2, TIM barrel domain
MNQAFAFVAGLALLMVGCGSQLDSVTANTDLTPGTRVTCGITNVAQGKPATASSSEQPWTPASAAFDGNSMTRWSSTFNDAQWLRVDLGSPQQPCKLVLEWEGTAAYGKSFEIQISSDDKNWTSIYSTTTGTGGVQSIVPTSQATGQYLRMNGIKRGTGYGYSIHEFQVFSSDAPSPTGGPGMTRVTGTPGNWQLNVDGAPYVVKGLTWGPSVSEADARMPDLKAMGVNTIRTWGTDASSLSLFNAAAANGIKVVAGFWLQPGGGPGSGGCVNYLTDTTYKTNMLTEIQKWVNSYKTNKGVLLWNVGNESILGMQNCFSGIELENQRVAYAKFVNEVARAIHAIDSNHPVTSTDAWTGAWTYLKTNAPDLDLYAVNAYNAACKVKQDWISGGYTKPYIITEGGPAGEWEALNDANGVPNEPSDLQKAAGYTSAWNCINAHPGVALGATLFHYGLEGDFGGVWFNLIPNGERRLSYYAVRKMYGGTPATNTPPVISSMNLSRTSDVPAGGTFTLTANVSDPNGDPISYTMGYNSKYINGSGGIISANFTGTGPWTVTAPQQLGVWKLYLYARDGKGNIGIETRSLRVVAPPIQGINIALNKSVTASSYQQVGNGAPFPPQNVTDGNTTTRWASDWSDPQWIQIDLGSVRSFDHIQLIWEAAFGKAFEIQISSDAKTWRPIYSTSSGDGNVDDINFTRTTGQYLRLNATQRGTAYGYALYEFGVY